MVTIKGHLLLEKHVKLVTVTEDQSGALYAGGN